MVENVPWEHLTFPLGNFFPSGVSVRGYHYSDVTLIWRVSSIVMQATVGGLPGWEGVAIERREL